MSYQKASEITSDIQRKISAEEVAFKIKKSESETKETFLKYVNQLDTTLSNLVSNVEKNEEPAAFEEVTKTIQVLSQIRENAPDEMEEALKKCFQEKILQHTFQSEFCKYCYEKPMGYSGDFRMMELIWKGRTDPKNFRYRGTSKLGELINAYTLDIDICKANIQRTKYMIDFIKSQKFKEIASIGSGSVIEMIEAFKFENSQNSNIWLFDQDTNALKFAHDQLKFFNSNIHLISGNIIKTILKAPDNHFNAIYSSGLFDYFSIESSKRLLSALWSKLQKNGCLLISNVYTKNPSRFCMEYVCDWYIKPKNCKEMTSLTNDLENIKEVKFEVDSFSAYDYLFVRKGAN